MDAGGIAVGSSVLVNNKHRAVVRYIGVTNFAEGVWYGLELERDIGKHTGTVLGVAYFTAPPKRGTFVKRENLTLFDPELEAVAKIQAGVRGTIAKKKAKQEVAWRTFNTLDADEESRLMQRRTKLLSSVLGARLNRERPEPAALERLERETEELVIEPDYDGPHLSWPLTEAQVVAMMDAFKDGRRLHLRYAMQILARYRRFAGAMPTLVDVSVKPGTRLTICGDTHGQLQDLFSIFTINGIPSPTNRYLMNGDFVDRGDYSCEILFTLMAFVLLYPSADPGASAACMLNRGNHESGNQNITGGFMMEVLDKYSGRDSTTDPERGMRVYDAFQASFDVMPLVHVLTSGDKKVFVVHGGMMQRPGVTLAHIAAVKRKREIPYGLPGFEDKLFEDLMWSDPRTIHSTVASDRGAGVFFGPDVTERFCSLNGISLVVRSHECVPEGYMFMHENKLLTVFSASRYCGRGTNRGAFVTFETDLSHTVQQFVAGPLSATAPALRPPLPSELPAAAYEFATPLVRSSVAPAVATVAADGSAQHHLFPAVDDASEAAQEEAIRTMLVERIVMNKPDLYFFWSHLDNAGARDGCVSKMEWADGMRTVLNLDLPWLTLLPSLVDAQTDGRINYTVFLDRYRIAMREQDLAWMEGIIETACRNLFAAVPSLEAAFELLDADKSGTIDYEELERGLARLDLGLSRSQLYELMSSIDSDKDGRIDYAEFASRFKVVFSKVRDDNSDYLPSARLRQEAKTSDLVLPSPHAGQSADFRLRLPSPPPDDRIAVDAWTHSALAKVGRALFRGGLGSNTAAVFSRIDRNGDGLLSKDEFTAALKDKDLGLGFSDAEIGKILGVVDANASGNINYIEFVQAFKVADVGSVPVGALSPSWTPPPRDGSGGGGASSGGGGASSSALPSGRRTTREPVVAASGELSARSGRSWQRGVVEQIVSKLFEYRVELAAAFRMFDLDGNGVISREEFRQGLQALTGLLGSPITDMQADEMLRVLDKDGDGLIDYEEFVGAFKLVDSQQAVAMEPNVDPSARRA